MKRKHAPRIFNSLGELNKVLGLAAPLHPLITLSNFYEATEAPEDLAQGVMLNFYQISYKSSFTGSIKYGQQYYDFDGGGLSFIAPNHLMASNGYEEECEGITLLIHPDFLKGSALASTIKQYGYFSYATNEALQLSNKERDIVLSIFDNIRMEMQERIDNISQKVVINYIELLLNNCERFFNRQFITRKPVNDDLLIKMEGFLEVYFDSGKALQEGPPTVKAIADHLAMSPGYLSDMLRNLTGLNTQQHIHQKLIEKAKEFLAGGRMSVAEVAFQLGFEHPQSFSKVFKKKTSLSPYKYQKSLN
ncbi:helix-turn-helix domain-containing protein [Chitinophaga sp. SYP-B3965]|uniref:helix-turn-helix domain-containing protein n=1 Tax=Chitinophaga sp. SYP-B3965 TaxID=2663120 RepID=UPI001299894B|nr:AraC family transcriptional regulator [Chitinophaga sp. SYP-B3965]MRG44071.1 helix-turn-helix domain-containing protein [Chitinophaga sp. SYP-B3965]